jgi:hypothetical protein
MSGRQAHRSATFLFSALMIAIGVALVVEAVVGAAGVVSPRLILGVLFVAAGVGRFYLEIQRGRRA